MKLLIVSLATTLMCVAVGGCASSVERQAEQAKRVKLAETHAMLGSSYMQRGQLNVAKEELDKALKIVPDDPQANNIMAVLQWRLKEYDQAERSFKKALDSAPKNSSVRHNYGAFLCDRGKIDEAIKQFDIAASDPLYGLLAEVNLNAGICLMRKPAPVAAEKYFREALKNNPRLSGALFYMAKISLDSGKDLAARGFIERFFQSTDETPESLLLAVKIERALRNKDAEASYAIRLRGKFPNSPEAAQLQAKSTPGSNK